MRPRSDRIFAALGGSAPDAVVLMNGESHLPDRTFWYVSGVTRGGYERCAAVLRPDARPTLVVSALEEESARTAPDCDLAAFATAAARKEVLGTLVGDAKRLGVNAKAITWDNVRFLREVAPEAEVVDVSAAIGTARLVKDEAEIERIRRACAATSEVAAAIPGMLRDGMTERELAVAIERAMQDRGGKPAFDTIVCFGASGAEPHYSPGDVPLRDGDMILVDFGAQLDDYCADITRMYVRGRATDAHRAMFDVVRRAQAAALEATVPGAVGKDVHAAAAAVIDASEFAGRFIHGLGHSIGLEVHDGGGMNAASELVLEPGMVMTVEPGVYVPGVGGVRIEDSVVVRDGAPEILTPVTKDLVEVPA